MHVDLKNCECNEDWHRQAQDRVLWCGMVNAEAKESSKQLEAA